MQLVKAKNHLGELILECEFLGCTAQVCLPWALLVRIPVPQRTPPEWILPWRPRATCTSEGWFSNSSFPSLQLLLFPLTPNTRSPQHWRFLTWAGFDFPLPRCDSSSFVAPHLTANEIYTRPGTCSLGLCSTLQQSYPRECLSMTR